MKNLVQMIGAIAAGAAGALLAPATMAAATDVDRLVAEVEPKVIEWRRYLHQHPELSNREYETAKYVAARLKKLGLQVQTGVAGTGVVAILKGAKPGPVVALRADMDALPVTEQVDLPFKSTVRSTYDGKAVGVMHACGHDAHTAMLLGAAEVLSKLKDQLPGSVKFIFQPAEESAPAGERGGAEVMVEQGVLSRDPKPEVIFGLHVFTQWETGQLAYAEGPAMASSDDLSITVHGRQTHGAAPWNGIDPIVVSSQIVMGLQTIASRQMDTTKAPVIVTIGKIEGGVRNNIIPDEVTMKGTLRALDTGMQQDLQQRVKRTAENIAESAGASADVEVGAGHAYPVTVNDPALARRMLPTLQQVAGADRVLQVKPMLTAEDFSFYAREIPGLFLFMGIRTPGEPREAWGPNHSPLFRIDESALKLGVRTLVQLTLDYTAIERP